MNIFFQFLTILFYVLFSFFYVFIWILTSQQKVKK